VSDRALVLTGRALAAAAVVLAVASVALAVVTGELQFWWRSYAGLQAGLAVGFGTFVWLALPNQPRNATVWAMAASIGVAVLAFALALVPPLMDGADPLEILDERWVPADSPPAVGWVQVVGNAASIPGLFVPLTLGLLLFPDGSLPSRRWRAVAAIAVAAIAVLAVTHGWWYRPANTSRTEGPAILGAGLVTVIAVGVSVVSLVGRFRRSSGTTRLQYKWVMWGTGIGASVFAGYFFLPDAAVDEDWGILAAALAALCWVVSYGIAVGRYRLYEIDAVMSRSFVFAALAAFITGIYVIVVMVIGSFVGGADVVRWVLATALVAVVFEPVRTRSQRWANRLVYGRRATPYEVLGELTRRLAVNESGERLLERLVDELQAATGARRAAVWIRGGGTVRPVAIAPAGAEAPGAPAPGMEAQGAHFPIEHEGETLGYLALEAHAGDALRPPERRLCEDLAASAALVVAKVRLDRALATKAIEIEDSRRRLVGAQDDELRRLERELSKSVGEQVAALRTHLVLAERTARLEGSARVAALLESLRDETQAAIDQIRSLAQGIHPPLLSTEGLAVALASLATRCPLEVLLDFDLQQRHGIALEAAVYYCVSEALTNAAKHANGPIRVVVTDHGAVLRFTVTDSGPGFDPARTTKGAGLHNMAGRVDALGGTLTVTSRAGASTTVAAALPIAVDSMTV
jgi:signal transduction histidine kinase